MHALCPRVSAPAHAQDANDGTGVAVQAQAGADDPAAGAAPRLPAQPALEAEAQLEELQPEEGAAATVAPAVGGAVKKYWQASKLLVENLEVVLFGKEARPAAAAGGMPWHSAGMHVLHHLPT